jgi:hypothetical protein
MGLLHTSSCGLGKATSLIQERDNNKHALLTAAAVLRADLAASCLRGALPAIHP